MRHGLAQWTVRLVELQADRAATGSSRISAVTGLTHVTQLWKLQEGALRRHIQNILPNYTLQQLYSLIHRAPFSDRRIAARFVHSSWSGATCHYAESFGSAVQIFLESEEPFSFEARLAAAQESFRNLLVTRMETMLLSINLLRLSEHTARGSVVVRVTDPNTRRSIDCTPVAVASLRSRSPNGNSDSLPHARLCDHIAPQVAAFVERIQEDLTRRGHS